MKMRLTCDACLQDGEDAVYFCTGRKTMYAKPRTTYKNHLEHLKELLFDEDFVDYNNRMN